MAVCMTETFADEAAVADALAQASLPAPQGVERLGGLTNRSYRCQGEGYDMVVRLPGEGTDELVDRFDEAIITKEASRIGVDSRLVFFDAQTGVKVMEFVPNAQTMHAETAHEEANLVDMAHILRRLHDDADVVSVRFDPYEKIGEYESLIRQEGGVFWPDYEGVKRRVQSLALPLADEELRLCHNDPLCENFVRDTMSGRLYLLDWEYAGMNDPLWDVADVIIEAGYDVREQLAFAAAYFGREATKVEIDRVFLNMVLLDFLWSLWALQRACFGADVSDWADERFARAKENLAVLEQRALS